MRRHELTDREWKLIQPHVLGKAGTAGGTGRNNRRFVNAVVYRVRTGCAWRDLPERFGPWNTVARRFRRWAVAGVWERLFQAVQEPDYAWVLVDSTTVKAHRAASGQKSTAADEALGRSRGGLTTKLHAVVDALGNCLVLRLTPGQQADCQVLPDLLQALAAAPGAVVADKAYDTNAVLAAVAQYQAEVVIPPKALRTDQRPYDANLYADRNKVERFFGRLKEARGLATRYEKTASSF
ncbi:IS5 family transposase, partial [Hymenobacter gummosus]